MGPCFLPWNAATEGFGHGKKAPRRRSVGASPTSVPVQNPSLKPLAPKWNAASHVGRNILVQSLTLRHPTKFSNASVPKSGRTYRGQLSLPTTNPYWEGRLQSRRPSSTLAQRTSVLTISPLLFWIENLSMCFSYDCFSLTPRPALEKRHVEKDLLLVFQKRLFRLGTNSKCQCDNEVHRQKKSYWWWTDT